MIYSKNFVKAVCMSIIFSVSAVSPVFADNKGTVKEDDAQVNEDASSDSEVITNLDIGHSVDILDIEGEFYKIALEGAEKAFILDSYVNVLEADGIVVGDNVTIRMYPDTDSEKVATLDYGTNVVVTGINGDFYRIKYNDEDCFVHSDYIIGDMIYSVQKIDSEENKDAEKTKFATLVSKSGVNLRREPSEDSEVIYVLERNSVLDVIDDSDENWVEVSYNGESFYVNKDFSVVQNGVKPEEEPVAIYSSKADDIINYGKKFIGTPYSWGGTNLSRGVDCSGFTYAVMRDNGIYLSRTSSSQINDGIRVSKGDLQKGDLVFFDTSGPNNGNISHVGIYIGGGQFIHSSSGKKWGITTDSLSDPYYIRTYVAACRVLN